MKSRAPRRCCYWYSLAVLVFALAVFQTGCGSKERNPADSARAQQELQQLREANQELQKLRAENQELPRLRRDNDELQRLRKTTDGLPKVRQENERLRAQLQALKAPKK